MELFRKKETLQVKLSIVTINRNDAAGLARTLESTFAGQSGFDDWEQIVVDGASTDGSFDAVDKWKDDPHLGWHVSEPDTGIYNAMNKGAAHARGDYLLFLNSGDTLLPGVLAAVFESRPAFDILYGDVLCCHKSEAFVYPVPDPPGIVPALFLFSTMPHQATFVSKRLHDEMGGYDESYRIMADWKFFLDCSLRGDVRFERFRGVVARFDLGGVSSTQMETRRAEHERLLAPVFGAFVAHRAVFPPEGRTWIQEWVAKTAMKDRDLAVCLRRATGGLARLWKIRPFRWLLRLATRHVPAFRKPH